MTQILIIDDERSVAASIKTLLEYEGFEVAVAEDGRQGVDLFAANPFDLVIVDMFMPGMDGLDTIKALRESREGVPIIAISGFTSRGTAVPETDVLATAVKLGAACSLHKPFRRRDIVQAVMGCIAPLRPSEVAA